MQDLQEDTGHRVTPLELFFDLVVVFAITQVTSFLSHHPTSQGLLQGLLLLGALWWAWASFAWLTNTVDPEEGVVRLAFLAAMAAMLVVALAVPGAFGRDGVTFGVAYLVVRALHLVLYAIAGRGDRDLLGAVLRIAPGGTLAPILLLIAGFIDGPAKVALWGVALAIDYLSVLVGHMRGWRISPEHFVERHGLVVIVALGESIFAIGIGAEGLPLNADLIGAALLGVAVAAALWWSYFDWVAYVSQARLGEMSGPERAAFARDAYSYLHLPMVAGIVLFALGLKTTIADVDAPLGTIAALGLCGGVALYLLAHVALRLRIGGGLGRGRPVATVVLLGLFFVAREVPSLVALALVAVVSAALIAYEVLAHRESRALIRSRRGAFTIEEVSQAEPPRGRRARRARGAADDAAERDRSP